jgi:hypothetical protein
MNMARVAETCGMVGTAVIAWLLCASAALAASPSPDPIGGDPRSSGQGPGLVGDPLFALLAVVAIGVGSVIATLVYVRLTAQRGR